jgi:hypothetical protein
VKIQFLFPCVLMVLDICAACVYCAGGDYKKTIYWIAAAILSATVTF